MAIEKRKWYIRKSRTGGYNYLFYKYSENRNVRITHNPANCNSYFVEVHYARKGKVPYLLGNSVDKTNDFPSIDLAFEAANKMIEDWDTPVGKDNRIINKPFERFAAENGIDNWPLG